MTIRIFALPFAHGSSGMVLGARSPMAAPAVSSRSTTPPFDLMIVDVFMPQMRGFESIRLFHSHAPAVPLIAISGCAFSDPEGPNADFLRMALELGATRCLRKPFRPA